MSKVAIIFVTYINFCAVIRLGNVLLRFCALAHAWYVSKNSK